MQRLSTNDLKSLLDNCYATRLEDLRRAVFFRSGVHRHGKDYQRYVSDRAIFQAYDYYCRTLERRQECDFLKIAKAEGVFEAFKMKAVCEARSDMRRARKSPVSHGLFALLEERSSGGQIEGTNAGTSTLLRALTADCDPAAIHLRRDQLQKIRSLTEEDQDFLAAVLDIQAEKDAVRPPLQDIAARLEVKKHQVEYRLKKIRERLAHEMGLT